LKSAIFFNFKPGIKFLDFLNVPIDLLLAYLFKNVLPPIGSVGALRLLFDPIDWLKSDSFYDFPLFLKAILDFYFLIMTYL